MLKAYEGRAWGVLECLGYSDVFDERGPGVYYRLENILTLEYNCYESFRRFMLWLEPMVSFLLVIEVYEFAVFGSQAYFYVHVHDNSDLIHML